MKKDIEVLRELAKRYKEHAFSDENKERRKLHTAVNDLKMIRPVILIDELPWNEFADIDIMKMQCEDEYAREIEMFFRRNIYKWENLKTDMLLFDHLPIPKMVYSMGCGINIEEETVATDPDNYIVSHKYKDMLATDEDVDKLHLPEIVYDEEYTKNKLEMVQDWLGDIIDVRTRHGLYGAGMWDDIAMYRGVNNLLMDLAMNPELMHKTVKKFADIKMHEYKESERLGVLDTDYIDIHCTTALCSDLPQKEPGEKVALKDIWGRGVAQIFASVSSAMHDEFDIQYMKPIMEMFGLCYYGCCEPLDKKIDIVSQISNLRKISITPWADVDNGAANIGAKYVLASKPNPAAVAVSTLDEAELHKELDRIFAACKRNNCSFDMVLKDISSVGKNPQNLVRWSEIAMEKALSY